MLVGIYEIYSLVRARLPEPTGVALRHADQLVDVERALGLFHEATIQGWMLPWRPLIQFWRIFYGTAHFVVPVVVLVLLWRRDRDRYRLWRNALGLTLAVALAGFAAWPLAPPRLLPASYGFEDTDRTIGGPLTRGDQEDPNRYAAMPSLHAGASAWCTLALFPVLRRRWTRALVVAYPVATLVAIVVTANHFVLDAVGGWLALAIGVGVASLLERRRRSERVLTDAAS